MYTVDSLLNQLNADLAAIGSESLDVSQFLEYVLESQSIGFAERGEKNVFSLTPTQIDWLVANA